MWRGSRFSFRSRTGLARAACEIAFRAVETSALYAGGVAIPRLRRQGLSQNRPSIGFPGYGPIIATNITVSPVTQVMTLPMPSRCGEISGSRCRTEFFAVSTGVSLVHLQIWYSTRIWCTLVHLQIWYGGWRDTADLVFNQNWFTLVHLQIWYGEWPHHRTTLSADRSNTTKVLRN